MRAGEDGSRRDGRRAQGRGPVAERADAACGGGRGDGGEEREMRSCGWGEERGGREKFRFRPISISIVFPPIFIHFRDPIYPNSAPVPKYSSLTPISYPFSTLVIRGVYVNRYGAICK